MYEVALFALESGGIRLVGRSADPQIVKQVRDRIAANLRSDLVEVAPRREPVRLVPAVEAAPE